MDSALAHADCEALRSEHTDNGWPTSSAKPARPSPGLRSRSPCTRMFCGAQRSNAVDFFFPDSQDQIDPSFDFEREASSPDRVRQRDDRYAHEVISPPPVQRHAALEGAHRRARAAYTFAQRHRLYRLGVREFFRLDDATGRRLETMGDCGAFTYVREEEPPYTRRRGHRLLRGVRLRLRDLGRPRHPRRTSTDRQRRSRASPSGLGRPAAADARVRGASSCAATARASRTSSRSAWRRDGVRPRTRTPCDGLQRIGYRYIALGGMVPLKTPRDPRLPRGDRATSASPRRDFHLLGITRTERVNEFSRYGVASFDSTSPFRQSFKDDRDNYYTPRAQLRRDPGAADRRQPPTQATRSSPANSIRTKADALEQACLSSARRLRPRRRPHSRRHSTLSPPTTTSSASPTRQSEY